MGMDRELCLKEEPIPPDLLLPLLLLLWMEEIVYIPATTSQSVDCK